MADIQWGPAIGFLAGGLAIGALVLWRLASRPAQPAATPDAAETLARRDLKAKFDALIAQLRELEDTGGKRTAVQLANERLELELTAAKALLALDAMPGAAEPATASAAEAADSGGPVVTAAPSGSPAPARGSSLTGFFWGIGSAAALGLLFYLVSESAQPRAPDGSVTGNTPMGARPAPPSVAGGEDGVPAAADPELARSAERVRRNPDDLAARLDLARFHLIRQDLMSVFDETQEVLRRDADNPRALSYQSLVRLAMGQVELAERMSLRALEGDPDLVEGYANLMMVYTSTGRMPEADATFARAAQRFPDRAESLRQLLEEMKARAGPDAGMPASGEDPHAGVAAPSGPEASTGVAAPAPAAPAASAQGVTGGSSVAGIVELDPSAGAAIAPGAALFVTLRAPGVTVGPPVAARRLAVSSFPVAFEIGQADSMTGAEIPATVLVEIRLDTDGDLATRPRSDPYGRADEVRLGTRNLRIVLAPRGAE